MDHQKINYIKFKTQLINTIVGALKKFRSLQLKAAGHHCSNELIAF
jgi:hypothetical protein